MSTQIPLTRGMVALVSSEDADLALRYNWHAHRARNTWYARTDRVINGRRTRIYLHVLIARPPKGMVVDHKNQDGLDNTRTNLQVTTYSHNSLNSRSRSATYVGVTFSKSRRKWLAQLMVDRKQVYIGRFNTELEALEARNRKVVELFGNDAFVQQPREVMQ